VAEGRGWARLGAASVLLVMLLTAVVVIGGVLAVVLTRAVDETPARQQDAEEAADVTILRCRESRGAMAARLRVTNNSSSPSDYFVDVEFTRGTTTQVLESTPAVVEDLAPGDSVPVGVVSTRRSPRAFDCQVGDVDRLAS